MANTITKREIAATLIELGVNPLDAAKAVDGVLDAMGNALKRGDRVEIRNFGVFHVKTRAAKLSNITHTTIPAQAVVKFKPGKELAAFVADLH